MGHAVTSLYEALHLHIREHWHTVLLRPGGKRPLLPGAASTTLPAQARIELLAAGASFSGPLPPPPSPAFRALTQSEYLTDVLTSTSLVLERMNANVGVETGPVSRLAVLDLDPPPVASPTPSLFAEAAALALRLNTAGLTRRVVSTPSGGMHYYLRLPPLTDVTAHDLLTLRFPGADLQLKGAYVAVPPTVLADERTYEVLYDDPSSAPLTLDALRFLRTELTRLARKTFPEGPYQDGRGHFTFDVLDPPDVVPIGARDEAAFSCALRLRHWPSAAANAYVTQVLFPRIAQDPSDPFTLVKCFEKIARTQASLPDVDLYEADILTLASCRPDVLAAITQQL